MLIFFKPETSVSIVGKIPGLSTTSTRSTYENSRNKPCYSEPIKEIKVNQGYIYKGE